jgi:hypothetical protein
METELTHVPTSMTPRIPAEPLATEASPAVAASPWEDYLVGKKVPADRFLAKLRKSDVTMPDDATRHCFAEALVAKPKSDRIGRLIALLQASAVSGNTIRRSVVELAEAGIKRLGIVSFPEQLDANTFYDAVSSWLAGIRKKPLKQDDMNRLFLLLHFGWHRQLLDDETAFSLIASADAKPATSRPQHAQPAKSAQTALEVLLAGASTAPLRSSALAYYKVYRSAMDKLHAQVQSQVAERGRLSAECASLNATITGLHTDIVTLQEEKAHAESRITELNQQIIDVRDGYQHKLDELRGRMRGTLQGQLTRWLQTALDASRSDPPWTQAIQERLEDALKLIEKEIQWLQPSA